VAQVKQEDQIATLREANQIVAEVLVTLRDMVKPGITTEELDAVADNIIRERGGKPAFLGYHGFPKSTCISVDEVIVHGIPGSRALKEGELVSIDCGVIYEGFVGDAAITIPCGKVDELRQRLMDVTDLALSRAIKAAKSGNYLEAIGKAVQDTCEPAGFAVVREFVGHGIGASMHEEPQIPNFVTGNRGPKLREGMVLAIEPMVNAGTHKVKVLKDGWTAVTADRKPSAHFEHSIVVRDNGGEILSATPRFIWGQRSEL